MSLFGFVEHLDGGVDIKVCPRDLLDAGVAAVTFSLKEREHFLKAADKFVVVVGEKRKPEVHPFGV